MLQMQENVSCHNIKHCFIGGGIILLPIIQSSNLMDILSESNNHQFFSPHDTILIEILAKEYPHLIVMFCFTSSYHFDISVNVFVNNVRSRIVTGVIQELQICQKPIKCFALISICVLIRNAIL